MQPKARFKKEQITGAALGVVSEKGMQALKAKEPPSAHPPPRFYRINSMQEAGGDTDDTVCKEEPRLYRLR